MFHSMLCRFLSAFLKIYWQISMCDFVFFPNESSKPPTYQTKLTSSTVFTFYTIVQLQRHLVADLFWYSGVPTYTLTIHSLSRVPATLHSISVNAHFTRFL
jgi:hypothetical protein